MRAWTATRHTKGNTPAVKWSPRVGAVYALNDRTVLRGYGLYWAPFNYPIPSTSASNYGQVGYSQNTILTSSRSNPTRFENPFPNGIQLPSGNSRRALTNLDSNISYVDQNGRRRAFISSPSTCSASCLGTSGSP